MQMHQRPYQRALARTLLASGVHTPLSFTTIELLLLPHAQVFEKTNQGPGAQMTFPRGMQRWVG